METDGNVVWKSSKFVSEFANIDMNSLINDLMFELKAEIGNKEQQKDTNILKTVNINKKTYKMIGKFVKSKK